MPGPEDGGRFRYYMGLLVNPCWWAEVWADLKEMEGLLYLVWGESEAQQKPDTEGMVSAFETIQAPI